MQHQELILGVAGQRFTFDPPDGRPARSPRPTVVVLAGFPVTTGECVIDPVSTLLVGDVQPGSRQIRVASTEGIAIGRRYLMTKPEREREWIEVAAVDGDVLRLAHPIIHRYAGAATIEGCQISIAADPAFVTSSANLSDRRSGLAAYMLRWTYTVDGHEMTGVSFADLVRRRSADLVQPDDVDLRNPGWLKDSGERGADYIAEALRAIRLEAIGDAHAQRMIRDDRVLRDLVNARANVIRLEQEVMYGAPRKDELDLAEQRYSRSYTKLVTKPRREPGTRRRIPKLTGQ